MESTQMHHILGISDKRSEEISKEVTAALVETGKVDEGTRRLMALIKLNTQMTRRITEGKLKATNQNAPMN